MEAKGNKQTQQGAKIGIERKSGRETLGKLVYSYVSMGF